MRSAVAEMHSNLQDQAGVASRLEPSAWCLSHGKRVFDFVGGVVLLVLASPIMLLLAVLVAITSPGPVLFRQSRVGKNGREFTLLKYRSMRQNSRHSGPGLTRKGDPRVTAVGRLLRRTKLDELPQLINVIRGDMSLVGPRPDLAEYLRTLTPQQSAVLALRPGITSPTALRFVNEEELFAEVSPEQLTDHYTSTHLPQKIQQDLEYASTASLIGDVAILLRTVSGVIRHAFGFTTHKGRQ
jgi:lipopolysaccharide/colanic/teichoic acid biosynthesis glycosyltransferase